MTRTGTLQGAASSVLLGLCLGSDAHAQTPAPAPVAAPTEAGPVYAPPPSPGETLPATPAPQPYAGPAPITPSTPVIPPPPTGVQQPVAGVDYGGQAMTPLPPPPPAKDPLGIRLQPWRGRYWLAFRMTVNGPLAGEVPARPNLLTLGGGADFGVRIGNIIGVGMGLSGHIQNRLVMSIPGSQGAAKQTFSGSILHWDALFARIHAPLKKRFQPWIEVGGGLARVHRAEGGKLFGAQVRLGLGLEGWVTRTVTLGVNGVYRLNALNDRTAGRWLVGHEMQGVVELGFHW